MGLEKYDAAIAEYPENTQATQKDYEASKSTAK